MQKFNKNAKEGLLNAIVELEKTILEAPEGVFKMNIRRASSQLYAVANEMQLSKKSIKPKEITEEDVKRGVEAKREQLKKIDEKIIKEKEFKAEIVKGKKNGKQNKGSKETTEKRG